MQKQNAIVITAGYLDTNQSKTAHGLIRGSERFNIIGVIDDKYPGKDAGEVLDGKKRNIPVYESIEAFVKTSKEQAKYSIIGVATKGGKLPSSIHSTVKEVLINGMGVVNGLHEFISEIPELADFAKSRGLEIIDVRKPKKFKDLHFWSGKIQNVQCPKIAVLGTDCSLGKRTTARFLTQVMTQAGYRSEMIYTGQTGWMQGAKYGFVFDSTLNDFISGEMEHAILQCWEEVNPDIIFIEGQSSLRNPSGPAGAEWIVSANADAVVLQHNPERIKYKGFDDYPATIADLKDEIALIKMYGTQTVAITLNTSNMSEDSARAYAKSKEAELGIPVILPLEDGVGRLTEIFTNMIRKSVPEKIAI